MSIGTNPGRAKPEPAAGDAGKAGPPLPWYAINYVPAPMAQAASVYATMLFPKPEDDPDRAACAHATALEWETRYGQGGFEGSISMPRLSLLAILDFHGRHSHASLMASHTRAYRASAVLRFVLLIAKDPTLVPSVKKAVTLYTKLSPVSERHVHQCWSEFKDAAHLWAAYEDLCDGLRKVVPPEKGPQAVHEVALRSVIKSPEHLLSAAQAYRDAWIQVNLGKPMPLALSPETTWRIPDAWGIPAAPPVLDPTQKFDGLTPAARGLLDRYRRSSIR